MASDTTPTMRDRPADDRRSHGRTGLITPGLVSSWLPTAEMMSLSSVRGTTLKFGGMSLTVSDSAIVFWRGRCAGTPGTQPACPGTPSRVVHLRALRQGTAHGLDLILVASAFMNTMNWTPPSIAPAGSDAWRARSATPSRSSDTAAVSTAATVSVRLRGRLANVFPQPVAQAVQHYSYTPRAWSRTIVPRSSGSAATHHVDDALAVRGHHDRRAVLLMRRAAP